MLRASSFSAPRCTPRSRLPARPSPPTAQYGYNTDPATGGLVNTGPPGYPSSLPTLFFNSFAVGNNWLNLYQPETNYGVGDTVSKTVGQSLAQLWRRLPLLPAECSQHLRTQRIFPAFNGNETGADVSDYFIGAPGQFVQCSIQLLDNRTRYGGLFGQDSWKATPNLTLNYGLRWDVARPWSDVYGRLTTPVPGVQSVKFPNSPRGQPGSGRSGSSEHHLPNPVE